MSVIFSKIQKCRYITSDCDAVAIIHENQNYAPSPEDAVAAVLKAGQISLIRYCICISDGKLSFSVRAKVFLPNHDVRISNLFEG